VSSRPPDGPAYVGVIRHPLPLYGLLVTSKRRGGLVERCVSEARRNHSLLSATVSLRHNFTEREQTLETSKLIQETNTCAQGDWRITTANKYSESQAVTKKTLLIRVPQNMPDPAEIERGFAGSLKAVAFAWCIGPRMSHAGGACAFVELVCRDVGHSSELLGSAKSTCKSGASEAKLHDDHGANCQNRLAKSSSLNCAKTHHRVYE